MSAPPVAPAPAGPIEDAGFLESRLARLPKPGPWWLVWLLWLTVLASPMVAAPWLIHGPQQVITDFQELYGLGRTALETRRLTRESLGFYPPSAIPVYMAFATLPPWVASWLTCGVYGLLFLLAIRHLPGEAMRVHPAQGWHAWLSLALVAGPFICYDITTGQVSGIPVFAIVMGFVWWRRGRTWAAAAALAAGTAFKLLPGACVLFFLVKRQWRMVLATGALTVAFMFLPGLVLFGPAGLAEGWREYHTHVSYPKSHPVEYPGRIRWTKPASWLNPSLSITALRWLSDYPRDDATPFLPIAHLEQSHVQWGQRALMIGMGLASLWLCRGREQAGRRPPPGGGLDRSAAAGDERDAHAVSRATEEASWLPANQYGLLIVWMILLSPHLAPYYMAWALWPVAVMMGHVAWRDLYQGRVDPLNLIPLWIFALSMPVGMLTVPRGAGLHPAVLLLVWAVMAVNVLRVRRREAEPGLANRMGA